MAENARRRSATISAWASTVQPGPPAPISPSRLDFTTDVRSSRRKSHTVAPTSSFPAPPSPAAYLPEQDSPTSSSHSITPNIKQEAKHDLPSVGYTSIFVTLPPKTPPVEYTPDRRRSVSAVPRTTAPSVPPTPTTASGKGFLRGLSMRHSRNKSAAGVEDASSSKSKPAKEKKSKYANERPPQISTDLALAQFMGGGKIEHHMKQQAKKQAKAAGATRENGQLVGVGELHRDGRGGVWRDPEEEMEYTGLLDRDEEGEGDEGWVQFDGRRDQGAPSAVRPSVDSLDPRYAMYASVDPLDASGSARFPSPHSHHESSGKNRRRPEPLTLVPENAYRGRVANPADASDARREFLDSSFAPPAKPVSAIPNPSSATVDAYGTKKSMLKGLFKSKKPSRA
ncbi:hypothetical protein EIP86_009935 [Pleurotus ostreatoroseus]|nr:hypothetical protein EIP86_009935 [Pleurotus ostreatoroseus]